MAGKHDVKLTLTRDQRRSLDRAAKAAGLKTGPWARSVALAAARVAQAPVKATPSPEKQPPDSSSAGTMTPLDAFASAYTMTPLDEAALERLLRGR